MTGENVFKDFAGQAQELQQFVKKFDDKALSKRPAEDKWSGKEIIGHLGDCELVYGFRFKLALAQPGSPFQAFE
ncbi:MAG: DinB family protein, partial [candidate division Zixibacteria bacterium]|nr:DinB family protein [candidate division Zixibacteria bacterium]